MNRRLNCHQVELRIQNLLDEREDPATDPQIRDHAVRCRLCRQSLFAYRAITLAITPIHVPSSKMPDVETSANVVNDQFADALQTLPAPATRRSLRKHRHIAVLASLATMVVVAVTISTINIIVYRKFAGTPVALALTRPADSTPRDNVAQPRTGSMNRFAANERLRGVNSEPNRGYERIGGELLPGWRVCESIIGIDPRSLSLTGSFDDFRHQLSPLNQYYQQSPEFPGIGQIPKSVSICIQWFQESLFSSSRRTNNQLRSELFFWSTIREKYAI